jgi:hypothetical protein
MQPGLTHQRSTCRLHHECRALTGWQARKNAEVATTPDNIVDCALTLGNTFDADDSILLLAAGHGEAICDTASSTSTVL